MCLTARLSLEGPRGVIDVTVGDTVPGIGRVQAITRSGRRRVVATTKGVITPRLPRTSSEFAFGPPKRLLVSFRADLSPLGSETPVDD